MIKKILPLILILLAAYLYFGKEKITNTQESIPVKVKELDKENGPKLKVDKRSPKEIIKSVQRKERAKLKEVENKYFKTLPKDTKVTVLKKKELFLSIDSLRVKASHVLVRMRQDNGKQSSFEAMVNEKTGAIIRTWNQTKFESDQSIRINAKGKEFYSN